MAKDEEEREELGNPERSGSDSEERGDTGSASAPPLLRELKSRRSSGAPREDAEKEESEDREGPGEAGEQSPEEKGDPFPEKKEKRRKGSRRRREEETEGGFFAELFEWVKILLIAGVAAFLLNNFVIANSTIPTGSMENTIMAGSRVFGSRLSYHFGEVKRGDVAIFVYGYQCRNCGNRYRETDEGKCPLCGQEDSKNQVIYYVKRVIGLPGDHIQIKRSGEVDVSKIHKINVSSSSGKLPVGKLYINGVEQEENYLPEPMLCDGNQFPEVDVTVPEDCYYMLGDNRNNSADARYWGEYPFVKKEKMLAKVYLRYWPLNDFGIIH